MVEFISSGIKFWLFFALLLPQFVEAKRTQAPELDPALKALAESWKNLEAGKYQVAQKRAFTILRGKSHTDLALLLLAKTYTAESKQRFPKPQAAEKAIQTLFELERKFPYILEDQEFAEEVAENEILLGAANAVKKPYSNAAPQFINAFRRLPQAKIPAFLGVKGAEGFSKSCFILKSDDCIYWARVLLDELPKDSPEAKIIRNQMGSIVTSAPPNPGIDRITRIYKAPDLDQTAFEETMILIQKKNWKDAIIGFQKFFEQYPRSSFKHRASYWYARALNASSNQGKAQELFTTISKESPLSYYGILSSWAMNKDPESFLLNDAPKIAQADPFLTPDDQLHLNRGQIALQLNSPALARREFKEISSQKLPNHEFLIHLAKLHSQSGNHLATFRILTELSQRGVAAIFSRPLLSLYFPNEYLSSIQLYAKAHQLDGYLVQSLMKQESSFESQIVSQVGAVGLMQLMPTTAVSVEGDIDQKSLRDSDNNIRIGVKYLSEMLKRFNGNVVLALCAYNAGPNRAEKWIKEAPAEVDPIDFIETIPFKETREYVMQIFRNYYWYTYLGTNRKITTIQEFWKAPQIPETKRKENSI